MSIDPFTQLTTDFQQRYGVRRDTAEQMVDIFLNLAATHGKQKAEAEFTKAGLAALDRGEAWAKDYLTSVMRTQFSQAPAIYAEATRSGSDPNAALQAVYGLDAAGAAELAALIRAQQN